MLASSRSSTVYSMIFVAWALLFALGVNRPALGMSWIEQADLVTDTIATQGGGTRFPREITHLQFQSPADQIALGLGANVRIAAIARQLSDGSVLFVVDTTTVVSSVTLTPRDVWRRAPNGTISKFVSGADFGLSATTTIDAMTEYRNGCGLLLSLSSISQVAGQTLGPSDVLHWCSGAPMSIFKSALLALVQN